MKKQGLEKVICVKKMMKASFPAVGNFMLAAGASTAQTRVGWSFFAIGMFFLVGMDYLPLAKERCGHGI